MSKIVVNGEIFEVGGPSFTTDETLEMSEDNVLGVSIPNKGVISQTDFDALDEEEKNHGVYVIPGENGGSFSIYECVPVGAVIAFMALKAPKGYLICDGSTYDILDYPRLATFFEQQFGDKQYFGGEGSRFAVPDMRNLFLRGYHGDADEKLSGDIGKKQDGTSHLNILSGNNPNILFPNASALSTNVDSFSAEKAALRYCTSINTDFNNVRPLSYTARPVNMAVLYCIKAL